MRTTPLVRILGLFALVSLNACYDRSSQDVKTNKEETALLGQEPDVSMWNSASTYLRLRSQAEVDAFDCKTSVLDANLVIGDQGGTDIRDLSKLACLTRINGMVQIQGTRLQDLRGLQRLQVIKSGLHIEQNPELQSLFGLQALDSLGGYLYVSDNDQLRNLTGLGPLTHIDALAVYGNDQLQNLEGLDQLNSLGHAQTWFVNLHLAANKSLSSLKGLDQLREVQGGVWITDHPVLESFNALEKLSEVSGSVVFRKNGKFKDQENQPWAKVALQ